MHIAAAPMYVKMSITISPEGVINPTFVRDKCYVTQNKEMKITFQCNICVPFLGVNIHPQVPIVKRVRGSMHK
jgi:hypothetical protein